MFCTICLDDIQYKEINTSCKHDFHQLCLSKWLLKDPNKSCPNCRLPISYSWVMMYPETRSKTIRRRTKRILLGLNYLMDLFLITSREYEKDKLVKKMFKKIYDNHIILKRNQKCWGQLMQFKEKIVDDNERYRKWVRLWEIKFSL